MATTSEAPVGFGGDNGHEIDVPGLDLMKLPDDLVPEAYRYFAAPRAASPIHRNSDGCFMVPRYDVAVSVYRDTSAWSFDKKIDFKPKFGNSPVYEHHTASIVFRDPSDYTRIRKLFQAASLASALSRSLRKLGV